MMNEKMTIYNLLFYYSITPPKCYKYNINKKNNKKFLNYSTVFFYFFTVVVPNHNKY